MKSGTDPIGGGLLMSSRSTSRRSGSPARWDRPRDLSKSNLGKHTSALWPGLPRPGCRSAHAKADIPRGDRGSRHLHAQQDLP